MQKIIVGMFLLIFVPTIFFATPCIALNCFAPNNSNILQIQKFNDSNECTTNTPFLIHTNPFTRFGAKLCIFDKSTLRKCVTAHTYQLSNSNDNSRKAPQKASVQSADVAISGYMYLLVLLVTLPVLAVALILIIPRKTNLLIDKHDTQKEHKHKRKQKFDDDELL